MPSFSPSQPDFATKGYFVCQEEAELGREAERHTIRVIRIVRIRVAVVVHDTEIGGRRCQRVTPCFTEHNL